MRLSDMRTSLRLPGIRLAAGLALAAMLGAAAVDLLNNNGAFVEPAQAKGSQEMIKRGENLVTTMGCNDCHTPWKMGGQGHPEPDMSRMLSGHPATLQMPAPPTLPPGPWNWVGSATLTAFAGPWGVSYAPNLTPHDSGLGVWTEDMFVKALQTGKHMGAGRPIAPPMPWMWYGKLPAEDLKAIYAYLMSIPPIENAAPQYQPAAHGQH